MLKTLIASAALALSSVAAQATTNVLLDFAGLANLAEVGDFYNGGAGTDFGVSFSSGAIGVIDSDAGGTGNFGGEPSPDTVMAFLSPGVMNVDSGFQNSFVLFYSSARDTSITLYDGLNLQGNAVATLDLPRTPITGAPDPTGVFSPFISARVDFTGTAYSVDFTAAAGVFLFDDISFTAASPAPIPLRAGAPLLLAGLGGLALLRRRPM